MDALNRLLSLVPTHDERGRVLCLASFAEEALGRLLLGYLRETKQAKELVEGFNAPLGTLATRIKAAFTMGLINREQFEDLEILRRVRNAFAHNWEDVTLQRGDLKSIVGQLHGYTFDNQKVTGDEKSRLTTAISTILVELTVMCRENERHNRIVPLLALRLTNQAPTRVKFVDIT
ncbi:MltR family transcriptional regulator [Variovorax boronicumulans]|uniref:MltR family transcriptional regulator n=1 Tax=Variovorax boronicumulans TaxID=436515 RepID=UPI0009EECF4A|nr:MltR family transcriptional regulator [Variovorax boronicumulans]